MPLSVYVYLRQRIPGAAYRTLRGIDVDRAAAYAFECSVLPRQYGSASADASRDRSSAPGTVHGSDPAHPHLAVLFAAVWALVGHHRALVVEDPSAPTDPDEQHPFYISETNVTTTVHLVGIEETGRNGYQRVIPLSKTPFQPYQRYRDREDAEGCRQHSQIADLYTIHSISI